MLRRMMPVLATSARAFIAKALLVFLMGVLEALIVKALGHFRPSHGASSTVASDENVGPAADHHDIARAPR